LRILNKCIKAVKSTTSGMGFWRAGVPRCGSTQRGTALSATNAINELQAVPPKRPVCSPHLLKPSDQGSMRGVCEANCKSMISPRRQSNWKNNAVDLADNTLRNAGMFFSRSCMMDCSTAALPWM